MYLREEGVEAVDFLAFLHKGIVLGDTSQCQFIHEVDFIGVLNMTLLKVLDSHRKSRREQADLMAWHTETEELFQDGLEFLGQELVCLIHNHRVAFA